MKLIIEDDEGRRTFIPLFRDELIVGRAEASEVRLTEKDVSRRHARLLRRSGRVYVEDLNSFTGVRVNGDRIRGAREVREGDLIEISRYDLSIQTAPGEKTALETRAAEEITPSIPPPESRRLGRKARTATLVVAALLAAAVAAALWLREVRGAETRATAGAVGAPVSGWKSQRSRTRNTDRMDDPKEDGKTSRGSAPPESRDEAR
jgi:FHA domain-containing protein